MRTRILVAVIGIPLLVALILLAPLWAFSVLIAAISAYSAFELLRCISPSSPRHFTIYAALSAFVIPIGCAFLNGNAIPHTMAFLLTVAMFLELMRSYRGDRILKLEAVLKVLFAGVIMPVMLSGLVRAGMRENSPVYVLIAFVIAFSCDSGAYFIGTFLGKTKIFPSLSPSKTLEGCIGGLVFSVGFMLAYGAVLKALGYELNLFLLGLYGLFGSAACQIGDLAFSAIKRQYEVKDYGTLIPGHGGVLDRFDSMHFVAPMTELMIILLPAITAGPIAK
jgi:phosphatidate cytidylyltransferase